MGFDPRERRGLGIATAFFAAGRIWLLAQCGVDRVMLPLSLTSVTFCDCHDDCTDFIASRRCRAAKDLG